MKMAKNNNEKCISGKVVKVIDEYKVVINKGSVDGITNGDIFLIYSLGEELFDPDTNNSLGILEIVKGKGKSTHVQEHLTTITCISKKVTEQTNHPYISIMGTSTQRIEEELPFEEPTIGDYAKLI